MAQGETRLLGDKPPGNGSAMVVGHFLDFQHPSSNFRWENSTRSAAQNSSKTRLQSLAVLQMSLSERLAPRNSGYQALSTTTRVVHDSRAQRTTLPSIFLRRLFLDAASPLRRHPDARPACFCTPSWSSAAWWPDELKIANGFSGRDGTCDRRGSSGFPPAETRWDLYPPSLERARARQGSDLRPRIDLPRVDASNALTNDPRFEYPPKSQPFCFKRPLQAATTCQAALEVSDPPRTQPHRILSQRPVAHARSVLHVPLAFDPRPSRTPPRLLGTPSPRIPRLFHGAVEAQNFIASHRSRPRLSATVLDMYKHLLIRFRAPSPFESAVCDLSGWDYLRLDYQSLHGARVFEGHPRDSAAPGVRFCLPKPACGELSMIESSPGF
ncbi:hypothetical protein C8R47DRAFT_1079072 [Mycena vitilis]|nr:hypothetical protein C8R47DRAFT_1079072 [Mycena vitilis]